MRKLRPREAKKLAQSPPASHCLQDFISHLRELERHRMQIIMNISSDMQMAQKTRQEVEKNNASRAWFYTDVCECQIHLQQNFCKTYPSESCYNVFGHYMDLNVAWLRCCLIHISVWSSETIVHASQGYRLAVTVFVHLDKHGLWPCNSPSLQVKDGMVQRKKQDLETGTSDFNLARNSLALRHYIMLAFWDLSVNERKY